MSDKLCIIALESARHIGNRVDRILSEWRQGEHSLTEVECPRFSSGEAKCVIRDSVRDRDAYILVDVCNWAMTYKMFGAVNHMSPDDHYQDLKRVIAACNGTASRITVIMPYLYEGRQHRKTLRESLDCAVMLRELEQMGVHSIITFDAHDSRMQNVVPLMGMELSRSSSLNKNQYVISRIVRGSPADSSGFSVDDTISVQEVQIDPKGEYAAIQIYAKKRNSGYLDVAVSYTVALDSPSYF